MNSKCEENRTRRVAYSLHRIVLFWDMCRPNARPPSTCLEQALPPFPLSSFLNASLTFKVDTCCRLLALIPKTCSGIIKFRSPLLPSSFFFFFFLSFFFFRRRRRREERGGRKIKDWKKVHPWNYNLVPFSACNSGLYYCELPPSDKELVMPSIDNVTGAPFYNAFKWARLQDCFAFRT